LATWPLHVPTVNGRLLHRGLTVTRVVRCVAVPVPANGRMRAKGGCAVAKKSKKDKKKDKKSKKK
jgi:hypothetical protein